MLLPRLLAVFVLLLSGTAVQAQRSKVTAATVFRDVDGSVLSKAAFKSKLTTRAFAVDDVQASNGRITSIGLKAVDAPDKARTTAESSARTYQTAAPAFTVADINGTTYSLAELRGKVEVVNFWFIKCPYFIEEMPALRQLAADYRDSTDVVFLSFAREEASALRSYVADNGDFGFPIVPLAKEVATQFGVAYYPTTVVIDKTGRYVYDKVGYSGNLLRLREAIHRAR